jgi:hypothetical protein
MKEEEYTLPPEKCLSIKDVDLLFTTEVPETRRKESYIQAEYDNIVLFEVIDEDMSGRCCICATESSGSISWVMPLQEFRLLLEKAERKLLDPAADL